jgi:hypothetical protein
VDGLPTWFRWIIVAVVGLAPILIFWTARILGHYLRRKLWPRSEGDRYGLRRKRPVQHRRRDGVEEREQSDRR